MCLISFVHYGGFCTDAVSLQKQKHVAILDDAKSSFKISDLAFLGSGPTASISFEVTTT